MSRILSEREDGRGAVSMCGGCEDVHVRWGETTLSLDRARFFELARMIGEAARSLGAEAVRPAAEAARGAAWTH